MKKFIFVLCTFLLILPVAFSEDAKTQLNAMEKWTAIDGTETHTIRLIDVTTKGDACGLEIDGQIKWVDVGKDVRVNGLYVKVFDAFPVHSQTQDNDACEVFISGTLTKYVEPEIEPEGNITQEQEMAEEAPEEPEPQIIEVTEPKEEKPSFWQKIVNFFRNLFG